MKYVRVPFSFPSRAPPGADSVIIDDSGAAMTVSAMSGPEIARRRRQRRRLVAAVAILGAAVVAIVALTARHSKNLRAAR